jgi:hypothetical protein
MCKDNLGVLTKSKKNLAAEVAATLQPHVICPSRRSARTYPFSTPATCFNYAMTKPDRSQADTNGDSSSSLPLNSVARTDYAVNAGYLYQGNMPGNLPLAPTTDSPGPTTLAAADVVTGNNILSYWPYSRMTGICFQRSEIRSADIGDGSSCTYMVGEKSLDPNQYVTGDATNDRLHCYIGFCRESIASTYVDANTPSSSSNLIPIVDTSETDGSYRFGSAHAAGFFMAMCDGSVKLIGYSIDAVLHLRLGSRQGNPATERDQNGNYKPASISDF